MRKSKPKKRYLLPDPKFQDPMVTKFVNYMMEEGKKSLAYSIFYDAIEQVENSISLPEYHPEPNEKLAIILGNEVKGVQQKVVTMCDGSIEIPQLGTKHSFNVSVSAGIVLWDLFQKMEKAGS